MSHEVRPWAPKNASDYYLASALYAYFYLSGANQETVSRLLDPRARVACDLYGRGLAKGLASTRDTNGVVVLASGVRQLPPGPVNLQLSQPGFPWSLEAFDHFLAADDFVVRGLTVRNREPGLGAPLIGIKKTAPDTPIAQRVPASIFLRVPGDVRQWSAGQISASLGLYSGYDRTFMEVAGRRIPLEHLARSGLDSGRPGGPNFRLP
jgi:hypothetical protein